jgi:hypothetical protein
VRSRAAIAAAPWRHGEPVHRSLAPPALVVPTFPRVPSSLPSRLLAQPSRRLARARLLAAAAAGLRRANPPALRPPQKSTPTGPSPPLDPLEPLPQPSSPARSPEFHRPRRPHSPRTALQSPRNIRGVLCKPRADLGAFQPFRGSGCKLFLLFCAF